MANFFYTDANGQQQGPFDEQQLQKLVAQGIIMPQTPLETETGHKGVAGQVKGLFATPVPPVQPSAEQRKKRIVFWTMLCLIAYAIPMAEGMVSNLLTIVSPFELTQTMEVIFGFLSTSIWILYMCCYFFYLFRLWEEIPREFARTTPGMAAGLSFVPFFNLYWQFVAFLGLYHDMNKTTEAYRLGSRFNTTLIKTACIAWVVLFVVGCLQGLVAGVLVFIAIAEAGPGGPPPSPGMTMIVFGTILGLVNAAITIVAYWITHKKVLEFIDIKSSIGR